jgi:hypothetical protein
MDTENDDAPTCLICKVSFARTYEDVQRTILELKNHGFHVQTSYDFDVACKLPCGHKIGVICLVRWLQKSQYTCPFCTVDMSKALDGEEHAKEKWQILAEVVEWWNEGEPEVVHGIRKVYHIRFVIEGRRRIQEDEPEHLLLRRLEHEQTELARQSARGDWLFEGEGVVLAAIGFIFFGLFWWLAKGKLILRVAR